jgi:hypothetical protein
MSYADGIVSKGVVLDYLYKRRREVLDAIKLYNDDQCELVRERLGTMHPYAFEKLVRELLVAIGYEEVTVTRQSGDKDVDVVGTVQFEILTVAEVVQVKRQKGSIGRPVHTPEFVRELRDRDQKAEQVIRKYVPDVMVDEITVGDVMLREQGRSVGANEAKSTEPGRLDRGCWSGRGSRPRLSRKAEHSKVGTDIGGVPGGPRTGRATTRTGGQGALGAEHATLAPLEVR